MTGNRFHCLILLTIIPRGRVGYEMIIANSALRASLAIYHLISNVANCSDLPREILNFWIGDRLWEVVA